MTTFSDTTPTQDSVAAVAAQGPFQADWDSLRGYQVPNWYEDGKFGIFIHWGVYSVPAFGSEWYPRQMYQPGSAEFAHHVATYGPQTEFGYKDFIPLFGAEKFDPSAWATLFQDSGARFVVPVAEHHDGFPLYDTALSAWNAAQMGPKRDIIGELGQAVRDAGMVFGVSSHRAEHFWFFDGGRTFPSDVQDPQYDGLYGPAQPAAADWHDVAQAPPSVEFLEDWLARTCELVDKYQPQLVWFDWWIQQQAFQPYLRTFAAYYYNRGAQWGKGVAINYKYAAFPEGTAVFDIERGQLSGIRAQLWQNDTSVSKNSWGYIAGQDYKTAGEILGDLVDIVSKNGALLLNIGPKPDGTNPEPEQDILRQIGRWLAVNGEAIYGTRAWTVCGEGPTQVAEGAFTDTHRQAFTGQDIRFTTRGETLYAIALAWPGEGILIHSLGMPMGGQVTGVTLLGHPDALEFTPTERGLRVKMPAKKPSDGPFTLKISGLNP